MVLNIACNIKIVKEKSGSTKYAYHKGNYRAMASLLNNINWNEKICTDIDIQEAYSNFENILKSLEKEHVPVVNQGNRNKNIWIDKDIIIKIKNKKIAWRLYRKNDSELNYNNYKLARNLATSAINFAKRKSDIDLISQLKTSPKSFWKKIKCCTKLTENVHNLRRENGTLTSTHTEQAETLNNFSSVYTDEKDINNMPDFKNRLSKTMDPVIIEENEVLKKLDLLNTNKSPGPDGLHPNMLKQIRYSIYEPLCLLFNQIIKSNKLPNSWKKANISAVYKKSGPRSEAKNYRPISLTSVICKIFESIIRDHLMNYLNKNNLLSKDQFGFRKNMSCVLQLIKVMDDWSENFETNNQTDVIYLDFKKAFDTVPHKKLIFKLKAYGISGDIAACIEDFLSNRKQRVVVNGSFSSWKPVRSGVPQGSVLGPILFLLYINDLPDNLQSNIKLFADDTKLYRKIENANDANALQTDLNSLLEWTKIWHIDFNEDKCKSMTLNSKNLSSEYSINDKCISKVNSGCDLGIIFDKNIKFSDHVTLKVKKANSLLALIRKSFKNLDKKSWTTIYKTLIRPHLEYGNAVWCPVTIGLKEMIERTQRKFTKIIPGLKNLDYHQRLKVLNLPSMEERQKRGDLIQTFKILNSYADCNPKEYFDLNANATNRSTRGHNYKLKINFCKTKIRQNVLRNRVTIEWNKLPNDVVNAKNVNCFKNAYDKFSNYPE